MNIFKRTLTLLLAAVMAAGVLTACGSTDTDTSGETSSQAEETVNTAAKVTIDGTKFMVNGNELWINGCNTPWEFWNDFCGNFDEEFWDETFAQLKEDNINCTRIWVNCNGTGVVRLKTTGEVKNINENHWTDLDKLFALAEKYEIYIMPTLLSFDHFKDEQWQTFLQSEEAVDSYAEQYVKVFAQRYGDNPYLFGIDLMNEPDWVYENEECGQIDWENISYLFGKCADVIHENSTALVTVGIGIIKYNSDNYEGNKISDEYLQELTGLDGAYVDFYSVHYYDWMATYYGYPFGLTPVEFGLDGTKPVVIGETSNDSSSGGTTLSEKYQQLYDDGWNGIMVWMEYHDDGTSGCDSVWYRYDLTQEATNYMAEQIPEKIYPLTAGDSEQ